MTQKTHGEARSPSSATPSLTVEAPLHGLTRIRSYFGFLVSFHLFQACVAKTTFSIPSSVLSYFSFSKSKLFFCEQLSNFLHLKLTLGKPTHFRISHKWKMKFSGKCFCFRRCERKAPTFLFIFSFTKESVHLITLCFVCDVEA